MLLKHLPNTLELWCFDEMWHSTGFFELGIHDIPVRRAQRLDKISPNWMPKRATDAATETDRHLATIRSSDRSYQRCQLGDSNDYLFALAADELGARSWWIALPFSPDQYDLVYSIAELAREVASKEDEVFSLEEELVRTRADHRSAMKRKTSKLSQFQFLEHLAQRIEDSAQSSNAVELSREVIHELAHAIDAEIVAMFPLELKSERIHLLRPCAWSGPGNSLEPKIEARLLEIVNGDDCEDRSFPKTGARIVGLNKQTDGVIASIREGNTPRYLIVAIFDRKNERRATRVENENDTTRSSIDGETQATIATFAAILSVFADNSRLFDEREDLTTNVIRALVSAIDAKDDYTRGHSERVALYGRRLAQEIGFDSEQCRKLYLTGLLHDIGKIAISDAVLKKPERLSDEEFKEIMSHPDEGWAILSDLTQLSYVLPGLLYHHERFDGNGYPDGLAGEDIPIEGRILAIADAYDAMTSDRPYRPGMPQEQAISILIEGAGTQWDPVLTDRFVDIIPEIELIKYFYLLPTKRDRKKSLAANQFVKN